VANIDFDVVVGADGRRNTLEGENSGGMGGLYPCRVYLHTVKDLTPDIGYGDMVLYMISCDDIRGMALSEIAQYVY
jgi:hypothetical protein